MTFTFPKILRFAVTLILITTTALAQQASTRTEKEQSSYRSAMTEADRKIADAEKQHSEVMENEEYLTTFIGPRLTGSPGMQKASQWTLEMFRKYGLDAHLESSTIPHAWIRGNDWGELLTPVDHPMTVRSSAWSAPTPGPVTGRLLVVNSATKPQDILAHPEKYKGAIILTDEPAGPLTLPANPANAYEAVVGKGEEPPQLSNPEWVQQLIQGLQNLIQIRSALVKAGAIALLMDSHKPNATLVTGDAAFPAYERSALASAYVSHPDYQWLLRLARAGQGTFKINLEGKFSDGPAPVANTVAQIRGSEHPDEQVIIAGHLDSWDLGEGAVDNGTGAMAVLEAARLLKSLGWAPKRTLTFILFYGEEQGVVGSNKFVQDHASEMDKIDAMLVDDTGTGRITSISLEDFWSTGPLMREIYQPLQDVFDLDPITNEYFSSSDHVPFQQAGVPAFFCAQEPAQYGFAHHSTDDVFEIVQPEALRQQAAVLAAWMWNVSEMPDALPHHPKGPGIEDLLKKVIESMPKPSN